MMFPPLILPSGKQIKTQGKKIRIIKMKSE
jgi:hypothetical protein